MAKAARSVFGSKSRIIIQCPWKAECVGCGEDVGKMWREREKGFGRK